MISEITKAIQRRQTANPRTVLGFFATILGLVLTASVATIGILASTKMSTYLIPWLLGFSGALAFLLLVGVFVVTFFDPSRLMLGQITGSEYAEIQKVTLGDSRHGERLVTVMPPAAIQAAETVLVQTSEVDGTGEGKGL